VTQAQIEAALAVDKRKKQYRHLRKTTKVPKVDPEKARQERIAKVIAGEKVEPVLMEKSTPKKKATRPTQIKEKKSLLRWVSYFASVSLLLYMSISGMLKSFGNEYLIEIIATAIACEAIILISIRGEFGRVISIAMFVISFSAAIAFSMSEDFISFYDAYSQKNIVQAKIETLRDKINRNVENAKSFNSQIIMSEADLAKQRRANHLANVTSLELAKEIERLSEYKVNYSRIIILLFSRLLTSFLAVLILFGMQKKKAPAGI
jgi:hypothetical protein